MAHGEIRFALFDLRVLSHSKAFRLRIKFHALNPYLRRLECHHVTHEHYQPTDSTGLAWPDSANEKSERNLSKEWRLARF